MSWLGQLGEAAFDASDGDELRLKKSLLMLAAGLVSCASVLWLAIYWFAGLRFSATFLVVYQTAVAAILIVFLRTRNFDFYRLAQLTLFLFVPFVIQWGIGDFVTASGVTLWGLLAPVAAILVYSPRESKPWFFAYAMLIALSAAFDFYIGDTLTRTPPVPLEVAAIFFALNFLAISSIVYFLLSYAVRQRDRAQMKLANAHLQLQQEQTRSEGLLLNVLPAPVAARLKQDGGTFADRHAQVSVMFADLVEFTRTARGMTPVEIFAMLNEVFSSFDDLADRHRLEKIKTIGDAYMVAGGLLERDSSQSAEIAGMALEMHELLRKGSFGSGRDLSLRIGIATGPVVAGVVGRRKFIYDLWGDTVNLASRITAEAQPGCILVDSETRRLLHVGFSFGAAQDLVLKGIGGFSAFELTGRRR